MRTRFSTCVLLASAIEVDAFSWNWFPDAATFLEEVTFVEPPGAGRMLSDIDSFKGMKFSWKPENWQDHWFDMTFWPGWTSNNWWIPLAAVTIYFITIPLLKKMTEQYGKWNVRTLAFYWNASLSLFSLLGVFFCVPVLLGSLQEHGLYFTCCASASYYGSGWPGLFVALFIYSKIAELVDTVLLLLAQKPVIALQWWHHSTVLLYCWHSYSARIATGLWFAAMNYSVHFVMYGYFACTATRYRKSVSRFAILITMSQLSQMLVGMYVTIKAIMYQQAGLECSVNKTNSILGLLMYFSYFVLFGKFFIDSYVTGRRKRDAQSGAGRKPATVTSQDHRGIKEKLLPEANSCADAGKKSVDAVSETLDTISTNASPRDDSLATPRTASSENEYTIKSPIGSEEPSVPGRSRTRSVRWVEDPAAVEDVTPTTPQAQEKAPQCEILEDIVPFAASTQADPFLVGLIRAAKTLSLEAFEGDVLEGISRKGKWKLTLLAQRRHEVREDDPWNGLLGFLSYSYKRHMDCMSIAKVAVVPESRGCGLGLKIVQWAIGMARKQQGIKFVSLSSLPAAVKFYKKIGFKQVQVDFNKCENDLEEDENYVEGQVYMELFVRNKGGKRR